MGAVKRYPYPRYVWAPSGGWWCDPPRWRNNVVVSLFVSAALLGIGYTWEKNHLEVYDKMPDHKFDLSYIEYPDEKRKEE